MTAAMRTAGKYLGGWFAIVLAVVLLSLLFTFLGTITSAVLAGMMMGVFKGARWFPVFVSLVFPGVIVGMTRGARVELTVEQVVVLASLCFGAFWATYLVSAYVFFCEQKARKSALPPETGPGVEWPRCGVPDTDAVRPATVVIQSGPRSREWCLEQLQGNWVFEGPSTAEVPGQKVIHIDKTKLELQAIDTSGHITSLATSDLVLQSLCPSI
jgi:hypothetical protein